MYFIRFVGHFGVIILVEVLAKQHAVTLRKFHGAGLQLGDALTTICNNALIVFALGGDTLLRLLQRLYQR